MGKLLMVFGGLFLLAACGREAAEGSAGAAAPGADTETAPLSDNTPPPTEQPDNGPARPNVLFIVADDLGFSDIGAYGGEILTPHLDALAGRGFLFNRFYAGQMCAPSRAMLLTGVDHHMAGMGNMAELLADNQRGQPGYEGHLNARVATLAEILVDHGYHTYMVGKWHLGFQYEQSARARGFERSLILLNGGASHFDDMGGSDVHATTASYRENGELLSELPKGFYSTRSYTDRLIEMIDDRVDDGAPFFAYAAYTAPHWPVQAPDDVRDAYAGVYDRGYEAIRAERHGRAKRLGVLDDSAALPALPETIPTWETLSAEEKRYAAREMEVYAAMVEDMDANIGRLFDYLEEKGALDDTLIVFMSDNGADPFSLTTAPKGIADFARTHDNEIDNVGKPGSFNFIGPKWAHAGEAPFRLYKTMSTEGGIRVPAIIAPPKSVSVGADSRTLVQSPVSVMDLVPTVLDLASINHPGAEGSNPVIAPHGVSLTPILKGETGAVRDDDDALGFELLNRRAIIKGDWKIVYLPEPIGAGQWELFHLASDPGEQNDLAAAMPEKRDELIDEWDRYVLENGIVLPPPGPLKINHLPAPVR